MTTRRVRTAVLWQAGDWRSVRERQADCGEDDYTDYHCWEIEPSWQVEQRVLGFYPDYYCWLPIWYITQHPQAPRNQWRELNYLDSDTATRRRMTLAFIRLGQEWVTRHQTLVAAAPWIIRCGSLDGQGTPCPHFDAARQECQVRITPTCAWAERRPVTAETACLKQRSEPHLLTGVDRHGCTLAYYWRIVKGEYR